MSSAYIHGDGGYMPTPLACCRAKPGCAVNLLCFTQFGLVRLNVFRL